MVLLLPTAIRTPLSPILSPPKSKINKLLLLSNTTTSFKTNFPSSNLFPTKTPKTPIPIHVSINGPSSSSPSPSSSSSSSSTATTTSDFESGASQCTHWMVVMDKPPDGVSSKSDVVDYYVRTLANVLGSEKEAQMCIYDASWETHFGFCCDIDEETSRRLFGMLQTTISRFVLSVENVLFDLFLI
ncbi:multiple organellar RNA editing factor 6, mitochondrial-like [Magnolia sinica]|uniref:multiple organellar RNA editing factor 6, mitochondrial-like n=1 Tax=Magnolia sinica TaxID=86752 RepID=UPI00265AF5B2|nr:multiple organellar RNA editing factor 6, mitochondrial-like [Magnolia sinica]